MISVQRVEPLEGFIDRANNWTTRYQEASKKDEKLTISRFWARVRPEIKEDAALLFATFHGKCAFCESIMEHVSYAHIEHYHPKGNIAFQSLVFDWNNWLLSCGVCNDRKWKHFPYCEEKPCLINPCEDNPEEHITFIRSISIPKTLRGEKTIKIVGLNRIALEDTRTKWLLWIDCLLLLCLSEDTKQASRNLLIWSMQRDSPYTSMTRAYLQEKSPRLASGDHPHLEIQEPLLQIEQLLELHRDKILEFL